MVWRMLYRAHLPKPINNIPADNYSPLRATTDMLYSYRAFATGNVIIPNYRAVPGEFTFEYDIAPFLEAAENEFIPFLRAQLNPEDFGIPARRHRIFITKPIALYSSGWFFDGIHKLPGFDGVDVFYSTVPPEDEGKPWWGEYYDPALRALYNSPAEHAFAEDSRSYIYTGNPNDPRVCCPALTPSYLWDRLRFFIRFFDTVYIFKPTEYARRQYYRFVEEDFPAIMRLLQGLSWLEPVELPSDVYDTPITETNVFVGISLGEAYYSAWREIGRMGWRGEWPPPDGDILATPASPGDEILPPPDYLPDALREDAQARHLNRGKWRYSPDSGYWPAPTNPTWWEISDFNVRKVGYSLLHLLQFYNYDWDEEGSWVERVKETGAQDKVFASYTTGYYDSQGNWIMPPFVTAVPPILIVNSTSGDVILLGLDGDDVDAETLTKVFVRGDYKRKGRLGALEYKVRFLLTTRVNVTITSCKKLKEGMKGYAPPKPEVMRRALYPYFELVDYFTYPSAQFLKPEKRQLQYAPRDVNRFKEMKAPSKITTDEGIEKLYGVSFHVATLPTGESSNVGAYLHDDNIQINHFVDNLSVELKKTIVGNSVRPWLEEHLMPALQHAVGLIKLKLLARRYHHPRMIDDDVTVHQVKMRRGAPSGAFPITVTSRKEVVSVADYLRKVGVNLDAVPSEYHSNFRYAFRFLSALWFPDYHAYPDKVGSFAQLAQRLMKEQKTYADFPLEDSPKVVMFRAPAVSPPELQFIPRYKVLVSPAIGLLWEWRYKEDQWVLSRHLLRWGWLVSELSSDDKDGWAALLGAVTLQNITESDAAILRYDAFNDVFYIAPYNQPIVVSALATSEKTRTTIDYNVNIASYQYAQRSAPTVDPNIYSRDASVTFATERGVGTLSEIVWASLLELAQAYNLKDNPNEGVVRDIMLTLAYHKLPPPAPTLGVTAEEWAARAVRSVFSGNYQLPPQGITENDKIIASLCGLRGLITKTLPESAPDVFKFARSERNEDYPLIARDLKGGGVVEYPIGGVRSALLRPLPNDENQRTGNRLEFLLDDVARSEILLVRESSWQPESVVDIGGIVFLARIAMPRLRSGMYIVRAEDKRWVVEFKDYTKYAYVLSSVLTYAPFVFHDLPKRAKPLIYYPVDASEVLTKPKYAPSHVARTATGPYHPQKTKQVRYPRLASEGWVFYLYPSVVGDAIEGYVIPPHQREPVRVGNKQSKIVALPIGEFVLQTMPLWLLRCDYAPPEGAFAHFLRGANYPPRALRLMLPTYTTTIYPKVVTTSEDVHHTITGAMLPDRMIVAKGDFDNRITILRADGNTYTVYSPDSGDAEHWVALFCGAQGYYLPCVSYDYDKHAINLQPLYEDRRPYPAGRALCMNYNAQEEIWFEGYSESDDVTKLREDPRHPYHWRIYMNITLPHPILPKVYALVEKGRTSFVHFAEEPMHLFGLLRWISDYSPEAYVRNAWSKEWERATNLMKEWRAKLNSAGTDLPTLYWLDYSNSVVAKGLASLKHMLEVGVRAEYFANSKEQTLFNNLVNYLTGDYKRLDYAPFAAYYAPSDMSDVDVIERWIHKKEPLSDMFARTPAALLVIPNPPKTFQFSNILTYYDNKRVESSPALFIGAPTLPPAARTLNEYDFVTAYTFLQEHATVLQKYLRDNNYLRVHYYTFLPPREQLDALKSAYPHIYGAHIDNITNMLNMLVYSMLNASAFVHPFYPNPFEIVRALKDGLFLGVWRAARYNFYELPDVRFRHIGIYLPLRYFPYPHLLEGMIAFVRARTRTAKIEDAYRRLCRPTVDFRLSELSAIPFTPTYLLQPSGRATPHYALGKVFRIPTTVADEYLKGNFSDYLSELTKPVKIDYIAHAPVGGYLGSYAVPGAPNPLTPFASVMFIKPTYFKDWLRDVKPAVARTEHTVPPWGARINIKFNNTLGGIDYTIVDAFLQMAHDYASLMLVGGAHPLHFSALVGALHEPERAEWVKRFISSNYMPIFYDGGFIWESMKHIRLNNIDAALLQSERTIFLPAFPTLLKQDELQKRNLGEPRFGEEEEGGSGGAHRARSWVIEPPQGYALTWTYKEIPTFTVASMLLPFAFSVMQLANPNAVGDGLVNYLERLLRACHQRELKLLMHNKYYHDFAHYAGYVLHLRSPLAHWLIGAREMILSAMQYMPADYEPEVHEFMSCAQVSYHTDPFVIEFYRAQYVHFWLLMLPHILQIPQEG